MSAASDLAAAIAGNARVLILKELYRQTDGRLSSVMLQQVLDVYGIRRDRDWVNTQLRKLEALGAVSLTTVGPTLVAHIERAGRDHVEERAVIEGVSRPADVE